MSRDEIIKLIINKKNRENKRYYDFGNELKRKKIKEYLLSNEEIIYEIDSFYENRKDSMIREKELIKEIGRIDLGTGPLTNLTDGGFGGVNLSPPIRKQISISRRKWIKEHPEDYKLRQEKSTEWTKTPEGKEILRKNMEWTKTEEGKELLRNNRLEYIKKKND